MPQSPHQRWQQLVAAVTIQYQCLPNSDKQWISERLTQIGPLQKQLNAFFEAGGGSKHCTRCAGECCARGHNHMTLANLLGYLQRGEEPPLPDFQQDCPFLGVEGCCLPVSRRPYTCVSFICDMIESNLTVAQQAHFYQLEQRLRGVYLELSERYQGASMTGLLLQQQRLNGKSFFTPKLTSDARIEGRGPCH